MDDLIEGIILLSLFLSLIALFLGICLALFSKEKRVFGIKVILVSIIIFIIAFSSCLNFVRFNGGGH